MKHIITTIIITLISVINFTANAQNWFTFKKVYFSAGFGTYKQYNDTFGDDRFGGDIGVEGTINLCGLMFSYGFNPPIGINSVDVGKWPATKFSKMKIGYVLPIFDNDKFILRAGLYWYKFHKSHGTVDGSKWFIGTNGIVNLYTEDEAKEYASFGGRLVLGYKIKYGPNFELYIDGDVNSITCGIMIGFDFSIFRR